MVKKITSLNIDNEIIKEAKARFLNMSEIAEKAIKEKLGKQTVEIDNTVEECAYCGQKADKATIENQTGLIWLWPHEQWVCMGCFTAASGEVIPKVSQ